MHSFYTEPPNLLSSLEDYDKVLFRFQRILSPARFTILKALFPDGQLQFSAISRMMRISDGAIGHHLRELEDAHIIEAFRSFSGRKPTVRYVLTDEGRKMFRDLLDTLRGLVDECWSKSEEFAKRSDTMMAGSQKIITPSLRFKRPYHPLRNDWR